MRTAALFSLSFFLPFCSFAAAPYSNLDARPPKKTLRIFKLLPGMEASLPLVEPFLPEGFSSICKKVKDTDGAVYYWGQESHLKEYQQDPNSLTGMVIKVTKSSEITQIGSNRFSIDSRLEKWMASGFGRIAFKKGRWGIFPIREVKVRSSKNHQGYKLFVGLNDKSQQVLVFELLYPSYLKEPPRSYKKVWDEFVKKTTFLKQKDLMVARDQSIHKGYTDIKGLSEVVRFKALKRLHDHTILLTIVTPKDSNIVVNVHRVEDQFGIDKLMLPSSEGHVSMDITLIEGKHSGIRKESIVYYDYCDQFPFSSDFLSTGCFLKTSNSRILLFQTQES